MKQKTFLVWCFQYFVLSADDSRESSEIVQGHDHSETTTTVRPELSTGQRAPPGSTSNHVNDVHNAGSAALASEPHSASSAAPDQLSSTDTIDKSLRYSLSRRDPIF